MVPWVTFTDPEVARVGVSEEEAKEQGVEYEVTRSIRDLANEIEHPGVTAIGGGSRSHPGDG